jgi:uncharacterized membrane protein YqiK
MKFIITNLPILIGIVGFIIVLLLHKPLMRLIGIIIVPEDKIGLVNKIFRLYGGPKQIIGIIATNKEAGMQSDYLSAGIHFWFWPWKYKIEMIDFIVVDKDSVCLIEAKDGLPLPQGNILATYVECNNFQDATAFLKNGGIKGKQSKVLTPGVYKINAFLFNYTFVKAYTVEQNKVGIVTTLDGKPLLSTDIAGKEIIGHNSFQNVDAFIKAEGTKGLQLPVIQSGTYYLNPWFIKVEQVPMTVVPIGHVAVIISYVGEEGKDITGDTFGHGNIVTKGQKGVWAEPSDPGKYAINPYTTQVEIVPTTNLVLNWATGKNESHQLDKNLSTITVRSKDGFTFNLDISQIIHVPSKEASKVIARFGNMMNLISQVLEPTIGNYFRNSAQNSDVIEFLSSRKERQTEAKLHISRVLTEYNVTAVDTLIGDIVPPASLMQTLTDRKIAQEQQKTFTTQKEAQTTRQDYEKAKAISDMQQQLVQADQGVMIAEKQADQKVKEATGVATSIKIKASADAEATKVNAAANAEKITKEGNAHAEVVLNTGKSTAEAYKLQVEAMGPDNFAKLKVIESISAGKVKIIPEVIINGGGSGNAVDALLGLKVAEMVGTNLNKPVETKNTETVKK